MTQMLRLTMILKTSIITMPKAIKSAQNNLKNKTGEKL